MMNFQPEVTPENVPVSHCFEVHGNCYVVDVGGRLFLIDTYGDNPDYWCWILVQEL